MTADDYLAPCGEAKSSPSRYRPARLATDEPGRWRDVLFDPGDVAELRCLPPRDVADANAPLRFMSSKTAIRNRLFRWEFAEDIEFSVNTLAEMNTGVATWWGVRQRDVKGWAGVTVMPGVALNIYAAPNPRITKGCSKNGGVLLARNLFVDIDNITVEAALVRLALTGLLRPTMIVVSGKGVHFYWRLDVPITDLSLWTRLQKRLIRLLGSDEAVHDPARVMRIPGFMNVNKNAPCHIHDADPGRRYALADIERHLPTLHATAESPNPKPPTRRHLSIVGEAVPAAPTPDRDLLLRRAGAYAERFEPAGAGERNAKLFARTCNLVEKFTLTPTEALVLGKKTNDASDDPLGDGEVVEVVGKAVAHVAKKGKPNGTLPSQVVRVQCYEADTAEVVTLDSWRAQMRQARLDSLANPGVYLDSSTTGAGKSFADREAMKQAGRSLTVLPTHDACAELVAELAGHGLDAAAHPPLDASTCEQFGTPKRPGPAQTALRAGLNVGVAVCPTCKHAKTCEYQKRREAARTAAHAVATHARASNSDFHAAADRPVVFVHEDAINLFRPMVKIVRHASDPDAPQASHLRQIADLAAAAEGIARSWGEPGLVTAQRLRASANYLTDCLMNDSLIGPLALAAEKGLPTTGLPTVERLPVPTSAPPERLDARLVEDVTGFAVSTSGSGKRDDLLHEAMKKMGFPRNGDALQLALAHAAGELTVLCAVIDEEFVAGQKDRKRFHKALVGVWTVPPPNAVVWLQNAHAEAQWVSEVVGRPVIDKTPHGRLASRVPPVQYADADVTLRTAGSVVRGFLRKVLALHPAARKVGVITHRCHLPEIDRLDSLWKVRIARTEYFHSGKDRASNSWLGCDLIVVLGTPRLPPKAVRDGLIRLGRVDAASKDGTHGEIEWEGVTVKGALARHRGLGYGEPSWSEMQDTLVKEALLQAVGRGRGVTDKGVPVVVVSNEPLGLTVADEPLVPVTDPQDETYRLVVELTARNAKDTPLAFRAVTTAEVTAQSPHQKRNVRNHLSSLSSHGLLTKQGERGGWWCSPTG